MAGVIQVGDLIKFAELAWTVWNYGWANEHNAGELMLLYLSANFPSIPFPWSLGCKHLRQSARQLAAFQPFLSRGPGKPGIPSRRVAQKTSRKAITFLAAFSLPFSP